MIELAPASTAAWNGGNWYLKKLPGVGYTAHCPQLL
jgi:hypothetical protein